MIHSVFLTFFLSILAGRGHVVETTDTIIAAVSNMAASLFRFMMIPPILNILGFRFGYFRSSSGSSGSYPQPLEAMPAPRFAKISIKDASALKIVVISRNPPFFVK